MVTLFFLCRLVSEVVCFFNLSPVLHDGLNLTRGKGTLAVHFLKSDPDEGLTIPQIIESRGFKFQMHTVTTKDGYLLNHYRIVNPKIGIRFKRPVVLAHAVPVSGSQFIAHPGGHIDENLAPGVVGNNLGFELAKRGYDVWLCNVRGNEYSIGHTHFHTYSREFWDFSKDEMIQFDLPATLDYIKEVTKSSKLAYIGHSQGTHILFGLLASQAKYNDMIEPFIALGPTGTVKYFLPIIRLFAKIPIDYEIFGQLRYLLPPKFWQVDFAQFCKSSRSSLCYEGTVLLNGGVDSKQLNQTRIPVFLSTLGWGSSTKNAMCYGQNVISGRFQKFDYGAAQNLKIYGSEEPPVYDLTKITNEHIAFISSKADRFAEVRDVQNLRSSLKVPLIFDYFVPWPGFSHFDFTHGMNCGVLVNSKVFQVLEMYSAPMRLG